MHGPCRCTARSRDCTPPSSVPPSCRRPIRPINLRTSRASSNIKRSMVAGFGGLHVVCTIDRRWILAAQLRAADSSVGRPAFLHDPYVARARGRNTSEARSSRTSSSQSRAATRFAALSSIRHAAPAARWVSARLELGESRYAATLLVRRSGDPSRRRRSDEVAFTEREQGPCPYSDAVLDLFPWASGSAVGSPCRPG